MEKTKGQIISMSILPFITMPSTEPDKTVEAIGKDIDAAIEQSINPYQEVLDRCKQLLSCLDYSALSDYQCKVVLLLDEKIKIIER